MIAADLACLVVIAGLVITILWGPEIVRLLLALVFVTTVPGWALVRRASLTTTFAGATMAIPASLAICAGGSSVMVWLGAWHPYALFGALAVGSAAAIIWTLRPYLAPALVASTSRLRP